MNVNQLMEKYTSISKYTVLGTVGYENITGDMTVPEDIDAIINKGEKARAVIYVILPVSEFTTEKELLATFEKMKQYLRSTQMRCEAKIWVYSNERYRDISHCQSYKEFIGRDDIALWIERFDLFN